MRHRKSGRHLNRNQSHRKAMFRNMMVSLIQHEAIRTTLPKAKELRRHIERIVTHGKTDSVHKRRLAFARLRDDAAVGKLFTEISPRYKERPGGYIRIIKCGYRAGDKAPMAYVEFVGREDSAEEKPAPKKATKAKKASKKAVEEAEVTPVEEAPVAASEDEAADEAKADKKA